MRTRSSQSKREEKPPDGDARESVAATGRRGKRAAPVDRTAKGAAKRRTSDPDEPKCTLLECRKGKKGLQEVISQDFNVKKCSSVSGEESTVVKGQNATNVLSDVNEVVWEDGGISFPQFGDHSDSLKCGLTVELADLPSTPRRQPRRASAEEKELAEVVHKVHLLCLLARGRLIDSACNDLLIQAALLSLLPSHLQETVQVSKLSANRLGSIVKWFYDNFHVQNQRGSNGSFHSNLSVALGRREGTAEEIAALSVALFRALNLTARFVASLDVASLKPDVDQFLCMNKKGSRMDTKVDSLNGNEDKYLVQQNCSPCKKNLLRGSAVCAKSDHMSLDSDGKACSSDFYPSVMKVDAESKRRGDIEFELQMEMAISATATRFNEKDRGLDLDGSHSCSSSLSPFKRIKKCQTEKSGNVQSNTSTVWSRRGPPLYWAEVYCNGETLNGRWVHVDAANGIVDGEQKVESAAAACRRPLKYVVAFSGNGAKDVTRRYCMHWYKITAQRVNSQWWDYVMAPLKILESCATEGVVYQGPSSETSLPSITNDVANDRVVDRNSAELNETSNTKNYEDPVNLECGQSEQMCKPSGVSSLYILEDMELETRALTEPLPTNQQAYKNHHIYVIERWLTKYQMLHPKGPILGYCSGHPVYPRSCVQNLRTRHNWLREGLQVKSNELPAKILKRSKKLLKYQTLDSSPSEEDHEVTIELYGKWQMEKLSLPCAVNGIVPKNDRGQVDVWSDKCLPHGTVHLRLPRLVPVVKRLEIDFAPAMVGFEFRNGRAIPVYEGVVVCTEFKDAILEAYREKEERRVAEEKKHAEAQALSRWFQLLSSMVTRQRLQNSYVELLSSMVTSSGSFEVVSAPFLYGHVGRTDDTSVRDISCRNDRLSRGSECGSLHERAGTLLFSSEPDHEHVFPLENQSYDEESFTRTKRCPCGFSIEVEEL